MTKPIFAIALLTLACVSTSAQTSRPREALLPASRPASEARYEKLGDLPGVQAVVKFSDRFYRGAQPQDAEGMASLKKLGVTVILSVEEPDAPEIEAARKAGIAVVNVPTEYNGIPANVANDLVAKYRDAEGTVYAHCHHGKHRGGAASAILRMTFEGIPQEEAVQEMAELGCSKRYAGLYDTVRAYRPDPAIAHRVLKPRQGIASLIEVTPWILRGTSSLSQEAVAALSDLGITTVVTADLPKDAEDRVRAAGIAVTRVAADAFDAASSQAIAAELGRRKAEKVFLHATDDNAKVAVMVAAFRLAHARWTPEETAREVMVLVPGPSGQRVANAIRGFVAPKSL